MLPQARAATWGTNIFHLVKAKATTHRCAQMLVMLRQYTIASIQHLMAALCLAYVSLVERCFLELTVFRCSSMPTSFPRTQSHKVFTAPCTIKPGIPHTVRITASIVDLIVTPCPNPTATVKRKSPQSSNASLCTSLLTVGPLKCHTQILPFDSHRPVPVSKENDCSGRGQ